MFSPQNEQSLLGEERKRAYGRRTGRGEAAAVLTAAPFNVERVRTWLSPPTSASDEEDV